MVEIGQKFGRRLKRLQISEQIKEQRTTFNRKISISLGVRKLRQGVDVKVLHMSLYAVLTIRTDEAGRIFSFCRLSNRDASSIGLEAYNAKQSSNCESNALRPFPHIRYTCYRYSISPS